MKIEKRHTMNSIQTITILSLAGILGLNTACTCNRTKKNDGASVVDSTLLNDVNAQKKVFYSLPSPLETAMLLKSAGASYNEKLLNPLNNVQRYTTNVSMALNMGVYITDLSFASLFDQTQTALNYMNTAKKLAEGLGIADAINSEMLKKIQNNINNKDVINDVISEAFMSSSSYLKENNREPIATIILAGGWIEGLYIATNLIDDKNFHRNDKLIDRVLDQKMTLEILFKMFDQYKDNQELTSLRPIFDSLIPFFDKIVVSSSSDVKVEFDEKTQTTTLDSGSKFTISKNDFMALAARIQAIRSEFIR